MDGCNSLPDSDQQMIHCKAIVGDYPRPVHFFIPTELEHTSDLKIFIHFHGHNLPGYDHFYHTKIKGEGYGDYGAFLLASKVNGVVVVPESLGNCATYDSYFAD
ncbi:MAG: hypothetical protein H7177_17965, partial [Rhizobacter sp.]|nr:hypothetical protein [Bacteriovorax sp.]